MLPLGKSLQVQLLGNFHLVYDDQPVLGLDTPRKQSFFAYLLLNRDSPQSRQQLAFTFWPDSAESQARTNLRNLLYKVREDFPLTDDFLDVKPKSLWWKGEAPVTIDLDQFNEAVQRADQANQAGDPKGYQRALEEAVQFYAGDLLPGCYEDWIIPERDRLNQAYLGVLEELIELLDAEGDYSGAIRHARELLQQDPLRESTSRTLMELHALKGDTARAIKVFHGLADTLEKELGLEPSHSTLDLYEKLLARDIDLVGEKPPRVTEKAVSLVGRDQESITLQKIWQEERDQPHLILIKGEAGIGKTYLAENFLRWTRRQGIKDLTTRSYPSEGELAYTPLISLLRNDLINTRLKSLETPWLVELSRLLPELKEEYPDLPDPEELSESWQRGRMFEACARALLSGADRMVILLDDLHWFDHESLAWLRYMIEFKSNTKLLFVGNIRSEELSPDNPLTALIRDLKGKGLVTEIELDSLNQEATISLAAKLWGDELDEASAELLFQETEGNPLFVVEVVRSGYLKDRPDPEEGMKIPPKIQAVIQSRLGMLSPTARELTDLASLVGREFDYDLLFRASDLEENTVLGGLDELWGRRVIRDQGQKGYDFSHEKFREVIVQDLSPHRKKHFHRKIAEALESIHQDRLEKVASELAHHYKEEGRKDKALHYLILAGGEARRVYARQNAVEYYQEAIDFLEDKESSQAIQVYWDWGNSLFKMANYQKAEEAFHAMGDAARVNGDTQMESVSWLELGKVQDRQGDFQRALESAEKARAVAEKNNHEEQKADAILLKGQQHYRLGEADQAETYINEALKIHQKRKDSFSVGRCLNLLGLAHDVRGQFQEARQYKEQAIEVFNGIPGRHSKWWIGNVTLNLANSANLGGEYQKAVDLYQKALEIMKEIGDQDWEILCRFNIGGARVGLGEFKLAEEDLLSVLELTEGSDWLGLSLTRYFLAEAYLGQGKLKEAKESARQALELALESGSNEYLGAAWRVLGKVASWGKGKIKIGSKTYPAGDCFQKSRDIYREAGADGELAYTLKAWSDHELKSGDKKKGGELWTQAKEIFQRLGMKAELECMEDVSN
jgi:DNA-binding SARP family transcriptional activator/Flp pilus assembly protein TadD